MTLKTPIGLNGTIGMIGEKIYSPSELGFTPSFSVNRTVTSGGNKFRSSIDWDSYEPTTATKIRYVDIATGSDSDTGDSWANAWKSILKAVLVSIADSDITLVYVKAGKYTDGFGWDTGTMNHDFALVAVEDGVIISSEDIGLSWAANGTYPNVFEATSTNTDNVVDFSNLTLEGNATPLTEQASIANVDANPGSWYNDGAKTYVRTFDSRGAPDSDIECYIVNFGASTLGLASDFYFRGLEFRGSFFGLAVQADTIVVRDCKFMYTTSDNGINISNTNLALLQNVESSENWKDGISYTDVVEAWEENCSGFGNGWDSGDADNGSTTHGTGDIVRLSCDYRRSTGPVVHDIATGDSWCVGCQALDSDAAAGTGNSGFACITTIMWLQECYASGNDYDINSGTDVIYIRNTEYTTTLGSITGYNDIVTGPFRLSVLHDGTNPIIDWGTGVLDVSAGGLKYNVTTVNAATYDLLTSDYIVHVTYTATGAVTSLTLPTAQVVSGRYVIIKDAGGNASANNITVDTQGAETIDGSATQVLSTDYEWMILYSDGSNWFVVGG